MLFPDLVEQSEWGFLALRVVVGIIFIVHGWPKIVGARGMVQAFGQGDNTALVGVFTIQGLVEVGGGVLLGIGVLTQPVCIAFIVIMLGAIGLKTRMMKSGFFSQTTTGWEFDLVLLAASLLLFLTGPGRLALDQ